MSKIISFFESKTNFYMVLFTALLVKNFPFGFRYFAFSDDYNKYGVFSLFRNNIWQDVVIGYNIYGLRPLAGLLDAYVITPFWGNLHFILLAMIILRFLTIWLLDNIFTRSNIAWGRTAAVFFALFPTLTEATYWISASSRIVTTAFLCTLSAYAMLKFIYNEGKTHMWLAAALICGLLAQGFYEQGIIFSFVFTLGILILHSKTIKHKIIYIWPFANLTIITAHYYIFRNVGHLGARAEFSEGNIFTRTINVVLQVGNVYIRRQLATITNTIHWGVAQLFLQHTFLLIIVASLSAILAIFLIHGNHLQIKQKTARSNIAAAVMFACTFAIYPFIAQSWVWVRNLFFSLIGLAIFLEILTRSIPLNKLRWGFYLKSIAAFSITFVFLSGYILEIKSIRQVNYSDNKIVTNLVNTITTLEIESSQTVWLLGLRHNYKPPINPRITNQTHINWALEGHFQSIYGSIFHPFIIPVMNGDLMHIKCNDVLLGLDEHLNVRPLFLHNNHLFFADTYEFFGAIKNGSFTKAAAYAISLSYKQ